MKRITIRNKNSLTQFVNRLHFDDELPVVVAYCCSDCNDTFETGVLAQMAGITRLCAEKWGSLGYNVIWIIRDDTDPGLEQDGNNESRGYGPGFGLVEEILRTGIASWLAVYSPEKITRSRKLLARLLAEILEPNGIGILFASPSVGFANTVAVNRCDLSRPVSGVEHRGEPDE